jgi:hypothetical protein
MAFAASGLRNYAHGGTLGTGEGSQNSIWHYVTNDADTVVEADGYFDGLGIYPGDIIHASLDMDGTPEVKIYVASGSQADVTVTAMLIV